VAHPIDRRIHRTIDQLNPSSALSNSPLEPASAKTEAIPATIVTQRAAPAGSTHSLAGSRRWR